MTMSEANSRKGIEAMIQALARRHSFSHSTDDGGIRTPVYDVGAQDQEYVHPSHIRKRQKKTWWAPSSKHLQ